VTSIAAIERAAAITWSPDERTTLAGWDLVSSAGFTRRTNCATPTSSSSTELEVRAAVENWLRERGSPLVVRITPLADKQVVDRLAAAWGLERVDETVVMTKRLTSAPPGHSSIVAPDEAVFAEELLRLNKRPADAITAWTRMVRRLGDEAVGIWNKGRAVGLATVADGMAAIYSVAVEATHRRLGLATDVMAVAESWAKGRGAANAFLQVRDDNDAARIMYSSLGYEEQYRYHYLQPRVTPA